MTKFYLFIFLIFMGTGMFAQTIKNIGPLDVANKTLDLIIKDDVAGQNSDFHIIYKLTGDFPYILGSEVNFTDAHVQIEAGDTKGRPLLLQGVASGGQATDNLFRVLGKGKLTLKGLLVMGLTDQGTSNNVFIRTAGSSVVTIENCVLDYSGQSFIRFNGDGEKCFITNSDFNRIGVPTNPDNGRFIDNRSKRLDSVFIENCTVSNVTSRFWRNDGNAGKVNYVNINNNTFAYSGQHGFDMGAVENFNFTNNIVKDPMFHARKLTRDTATARHVIEIKEYIPGTTKINVAYNNIFVSKMVKDSTPFTNVGGDTLMTVEGFIYGVALKEGMVAAGTLGTNISEELTFENGPKLPGQFIRAKHFDVNPGNTIPNAGVWDVSNLTPYTLYSGTNLGSSTPINRYIELYSYCYSSSSNSATASSDGKPIGGGLTGCNFSSTKNWITTYPISSLVENPVNDKVVLHMQEEFLDKNTQFSIFNLSGIQMGQGTIPSVGERVELEVADFPTGTYFIKLNNSNKTQTLKFIKI